MPNGADVGERLQVPYNCGLVFGPAQGQGELRAELEVVHSIRVGVQRYLEYNSLTLYYELLELSFSKTKSLPSHPSVKAITLLGGRPARPPLSFPIGVPPTRGQSPGVIAGGIPRRRRTEGRGRAAGRRSCAVWPSPLRRGSCGRGGRRQTRCSCQFLRGGRGGGGGEDRRRRRRRKHTFKIAKYIAIYFEDSIPVP